jgi:hypothetical protein
METTMLIKNIAGDLEISDRSTLAFEMPVVVCDSSETLLDEFDATVYLGARLTATVVNETGEIEINEFMVIHDGTDAYIKNLSTLNNLPSNGFVGVFRAELFRGFVRVFVTGSGNVNQVRFFKLMFKR